MNAADGFICENCGLSFGVMEHENGHYFCARCDWMVRDGKRIVKAFRDHNIKLERTRAVMVIFGKDEK